MPVRYYLIDGLNSVQRANIVKLCLSFLHVSRVIISSLTFDGTSVNITMAEILGAGMTPHHNWKPWFKHPEKDGQNVYIILDAAAMGKYSCMWVNETCGQKQ